MTSLLSGLAPWMPWILVGLGVAALVVLGVITWLLLGNTVPEDEGSESPPELTDTTAPLWALNASETLRGATGLSTAHLSRAAGVFSPLLIRNSIRKSLRTVRKFAPRRIGRGDEPWILALGPDGSGKREVLEGLTLPRVLPELAREPVGWYVFDQGVVLDVPESLIQDASGAGDDRGWDSFLSALVGVRPERPADGVVLVLPARDLLASEASSEGSRFAEQLEDQLFRRLQRAQAVLGLRFPVHVLIHGLEDIPGFSAFSEALPEGLRQEIFGWSSPYPLESAFQSDWTQEAFREIGERLEKISTEILATQATGDHANEIFRFPERFEHLRTRTTSLLCSGIRPTTRGSFFGESISVRVPAPQPRGVRF
jgi:type VI secretion system protein ImpL